MNELNYSNRRFIRKQAVCAFYTLFVLREVHRAFANDEIKKDFAFNSLKNSLSEKKILERQCEEALKCFGDFFSKNIKPENFHHNDPKVLASVKNAYYRYQASASSELLSQSAALDRIELEINHIALSIIQLLIEWGKLLSDAKFLLLLAKDINPQNILKKITHNPLLSRLTASEQFYQALKQYSVDWSKEKIQVEDYLISALPFLEKNISADDTEFLTKAVKKCIYSESGALETLMKKSLAWGQISFLVLGILKKIFSTIDQTSAVREVFGEHHALFKMSEEGKDFFRKLLKTTADNEVEIENFLDNTLENWDLSRVVPLDKIIAKLGVCEIIFFPEIPKAVSINEYIDIAKEYGSEQSGKFINGVLNAVSAKNF